MRDRMLGLIVSFAILLLFGCAGIKDATNGGFGADPGSRTGNIAFRGLDGNIYISDPSGGEIVSMTDNAGTSPSGLYREYRYATWSPDGKSVAYFEPQIVQRAGRDIFLLQVKVLHVQNGEITLVSTIRPTRAFMRQLVPFYDQYQRSATIWSPDSRHIVLNAVTRDSKPGVYVISLDNLEEPKFIAYGLLPVWSPR